MSDGQAYLLVAVAALLGLAVFGILRQREARPAIAGCLAIVAPLLLVALVFAVIILRDRA